MRLFTHLAMTVGGDLGPDRPVLPMKGVEGISLPGRHPQQPSLQRVVTGDQELVDCYITCSVYVSPLRPHHPKARIRLANVNQRRRLQSAAEPMPWSPTL